MDYGNVLARAWQISWRWKVLWILGLLAGLGRAMSGGSNSQYSTSGSEWGGIPPEVAAGLAGAACLGIIVAIILWVVSVIARGGLIAGVQQVEEEGHTSFGSAWRGGARKFWTLFGIGVLAAIPMILAILLGGIASGMLLIFSRKGRKAKFAYGPYLVLGAWLAIVWGQQITDWYLG